MSWLSSLGGKVKDAAVGVGHAVGKVASNPLVDTGIGALFGPGAAAAAGGLGRLLTPGGNIGNAAVSAGTGYLAGKGGQFLRSHLPGGGGAGAPESGGYNPADASQAAPGGGGVGGFLRSAGNFLTGGGAGAMAGGASGAGGGGVNPLLLGLAGAQTVNAANLGNRANQYSDDALKSVTDSYAARAPLRSAGISGLLTPRPMPNTANLSTLRMQNPVARRAAG